MRKRKVLHTSVTALVAVVKYGHQLDDNCLMRIVTALWVSLCFLTNPHTICYSNLQVPWLLWLTLKVCFYTIVCTPAFCLCKNFFQFSWSLQRCKGNDDFMGIVHFSKICLWTSVSSFTFFAQQCSLVTKYSLGTQVQMPFCTLLTLGTLEMFLCWNTCALVGGLVLTGQCAVRPTPLHCPPWLPQGENPRSLDIWVTRPWDIWIVGLQDNRDIGLWDMWEVERWDIWYVQFGIFETNLLDVWDIGI